MNSIPGFVPEHVDSPEDIRAHVAFFCRYARAEMAHCPHAPEPEHLKLAHTMAVLKNARHICQGEMEKGTLPQRLVRPALLAALYHDLGRFAQYRTFKSFKDAQSCNHGALSAGLLVRYGILAREQPDDGIICAAVGVHNAFALPPADQMGVQDRGEDALLVARVVRDADKLDILRVMDKHLSGPGPYEPTVVLSLPNDPVLFSQYVLDCALTGRVPGYTDLRSVNDFRVLLATWIHALEFATSRAIMRREGHARRLLEQLPARGSYAGARAHLLELLAKEE